VPPVADAVRSAIASALAADPAALTPQTSLYDDLGADSLTVMEILTALEDELGIELPTTNEFALGVRTVGDVVTAFETRAPT
jgi:acyl carrier protein